VNRKALLSSASTEWETPDDLYWQLHDEFGFDLDAAATGKNAKCTTYFTKADDSLSKEWKGTVWCNPPYGRGIGLWMKKAFLSAKAGATVVMLVPARVGTKWWAQWVAGMTASEVRFVIGRVKFTREDGLCESAPFDSAIVIYRPILGKYRWWSAIP
jgi:phage N-6-adenine-methyltransferase